jgi:fumarate hydratase class I
MDRFGQSILALIARTSSNLPADVRRALARARRAERPGTRAALALDTIAVNVDLACESCRPICQDTGLPTFYVSAPPGLDQMRLAEEIGEAVAEATRRGYLRPNAVDPLTGLNRGDNRAAGIPAVHFEQWVSDQVEVQLLLKGGGCENKSAQYSLPCELDGLGRAERTLDGIRRCVLHAVHAAQGQGCSVGILGVAVGGDRGSGHETAKAQLLRPLDDRNPDPLLAVLEQEIVRQANTLGIGPMGFGGSSTVAACKVASLGRLPASFFVSVAYECWALRRLGVLLDGQTGAILRWLHQAEEQPARLAARDVVARTGREIPLATPLVESTVRRLHVGDVVLVDGVVHTGRDRLHHHLATHEPPTDLRGGVLYHCGPVALREANGWTITAAGPTTSMREEPYQADVLRRFGVRAVIGKGGMGARTLAALKECGAVYLTAVGGAAQYYARCVESVEGVDFIEWGVPEAMWHLRVRDFPAVVTMDAWGQSLHAGVEEVSARALAALQEPSPA